MNDLWTDWFLSFPWLGSLVWTVLHSLDYYLTLYGHYLYHAGANKVIVFEGSYELNPIFERDVERRLWFSKRFLVSLFMGAVVLFCFALYGGFLAQQLAASAVVSNWGKQIVGLLLGAVIFTKIKLIAGHLQNAWLFRRILRADASITGSVRYDRRTILFLAAHSFATWALLLGVAALLSGNSWIIGGSLGCALVAAKCRSQGKRYIPTVIAVDAKGDANERQELDYAKSV